MDFLEKDLEDIIYTSDQSILRDRGLIELNYSTILRQFNLDKYGIVDIITIQRVLARTYYVTVWELKNKEINAQCFWQLTRYMKGIRHLLNLINISDVNFNINGVMVGRKLNFSDDVCFLPTINSNISIYTYSYGLNGISFKILHDEYVKTGFNLQIVSSCSDITPKQFLKILANA